MFGDLGQQMQDMQNRVNDFQAQLRQAQQSIMPALQKMSQPAAPQQQQQPAPDEPSAVSIENEILQEYLSQSPEALQELSMLSATYLEWRRSKDAEEFERDYPQGKGIVAKIKRNAIAWARESLKRQPEAQPETTQYPAVQEPQNG